MKQHPWGKATDWAQVAACKLEPAFVPSIEKCNFDPEYVRENSTTAQRPLGRQRCSAQSSVHSYAYTDD